jgi:phage baseplate assembly protein W
MNAVPVTLGFPFVVDGAGRVTATGGDETIRAKIIQLLFTAPGERVNKPEFGCGLFNLVFEPNNVVLAAAMEFTIGQALSRWLRRDIVVDGVSVRAEDEQAVVEVAYRTTRDLATQAVSIRFRI